MTIYDFIVKEKAKYTKAIKLETGWEWSMKDHLRRSFLYKNSQFEENNEDRYLRPNKNIVLAILLLQYRTEDFNVKDIDLFVNDSEEYWKSFLVKKFHDKWALENQIDTFIDEMVESYVDYGGALIRNAGKRPEVIDLRNLAFCNQKDILAYPFAIEHNLSPSQLRDYEDWGLPENGATIDLESLITLCKDKEEIKVYEVHGTMPSEYLKGESKDVNQIQCVAFYQDQNNQEVGVTLFAKKMPKLPFKFLKRDDIKGRALGRGGVEELFDAQIWTNWNEIKVCEMLNAASRIIHWTNDPTLAAKHPSGMKGMDNNEFLDLTAGTQIGTVDTFPRNLALFNNSLDRWEKHAQTKGVASEGLLGETPLSGTPFKLYEAKNQEDKSMHRFRQGKLAVFMDEIYRDWVLPHIAKEITKDHEFLADLTVDEMMKVSEDISVNERNEKAVEMVMKYFTTNGTPPTNEELDAFQEASKQARRKNPKQFIKILRDEIAKNLDVSTNIAGKQKNLALMTDKITSVIQQFLAAPQLRQDPEMIRLVNIMLESSGMSPIMFGLSPQQTMLPQGQMAQLAQNNQAVLQQ